MLGGSASRLPSELEPLERLVRSAFGGAVVGIVYEPLVSEVPSPMDGPVRDSGARAWRAALVEQVFRCVGVESDAGSSTAVEELMQELYEDERAARISRSQSPYLRPGSSPSPSSLPLLCRYRCALCIPDLAALASARPRNPASLFFRSGMRRAALAPVPSPAASGARAALFAVLPGRGALDPAALAVLREAAVVLTQTAEAQLTLSAQARQLRELRSVRARSIRFLDMMAEGVFLCEARGARWKVLYANETAALGVRSSQEAMLGRSQNFWHLFRPVGPLMAGMGPDRGGEEGWEESKGKAGAGERNREARVVTNPCASASSGGASGSPGGPVRFQVPAPPQPANALQAALAKGARGRPFAAHVVAQADEPGRRPYRALFLPLRPWQLVCCDVQELLRAAWKDARAAGWDLPADRGVGPGHYGLASPLGSGSPDGLTSMPKSGPTDGLTSPLKSGSPGVLTGPLKPELQAFLDSPEKPSAFDDTPDSGSQTLRPAQPSHNLESWAGCPELNVAVQANLSLRPLISTEAMGIWEGDALGGPSSGDALGNFRSGDALGGPSSSPPSAAASALSSPSKSVTPLAGSSARSARGQVYLVILAPSPASSASSSSRATPSAPSTRQASVLGPFSALAGEPAAAGAAPGGAGARRAAISAAFSVAAPGGAPAAEEEMRALGSWTGARADLSREVQLGPLAPPGASGRPGERMHWGLWRGARVAVRIAQADAAGEAQRLAALETALGRALTHPQLLPIYAYGLVQGQDRRGEEEEGRGRASLPSQSAPFSSEDGKRAPPRPSLPLPPAPSAPPPASARPPRPDVWIVQALCSRGSLADAVAKDVFCGASGSVSLPAVLLTAREVAGALAYLHASGICHGALCAESVLLASSGRDARRWTAVVGRFGLHAAVGAGASRPELPAAALSPESLGGELPQFESDVFCLGVLLWEMCAGRRAWEGEDRASISLGLARGDLSLSLDSLSRGVPPALRALVAHCLSPDPWARPACADLLDSLGLQLRAALVGRKGQAA